MTWAYIAGFFDGEGCIRHQTAKSASQITMVQSTVQDEVLFKIHEFLVANGVKAGLSVHSGSWGNHANGDVRGLRTLSVSNADSLIIFFDNVIPHLIVKKAKAEVGLARAKDVQLRKQQVVERIELAASLYRQGFSIPQIKSHCHVGSTSVRNYLVAAGFNTRSIREGQRLRRLHGSISIG